MSLPAPLKAACRYGRRVLVALDQLGNALGGGEPDETISYRAAVARAAGSRPACLLCGFLALFEPDHCGIVLARRDTRALPGSPSASIPAPDRAHVSAAG